MHLSNESQPNAEESRGKDGVLDCWSCRAKTANGREAPASHRRASTSPSRTRANHGSPHCQHSNYFMISELTRTLTAYVERLRWSETAAVGNRRGSRSSAAKSSHASMAGSSHWALTSTKTWMP